jgi:hypothetical protein
VSRGRRQASPRPGNETYFSVSGRSGARIVLLHRDTMTDDMCATWCNACSTGDRNACLGVTMNPQCKKSCPKWLRNMGKPFDDPLQSSLEAFVSDWNNDTEKSGPDRDSRSLRSSTVRARGRERLTPAPFTNRMDIWGGGLRRMTSGSVGPRREDEHYYAPRYVPIGFARYKDPTVDPADYTYYQMSGWRVAVPRTVPGPAVRALLMRIYQYGPKSAGYARLGDTIVPAILSPGDRRTLAQSSSRYGPISRKYPMA